MAALLSACAIIDTVDPRYDVVNRSAARARNESILLNIVRASHNLPLNFIAFSKVSGAQSVTGAAGLPTFALGPGPLVALYNRQAIFGSTVLSANAAMNNNFDISILESRDFYNGLLSPVDLPTLYFFIRQGYSRQLLFWLFTESVRETVAGRTYEYRNDPDPQISCESFRGRRRCFEHMVDIALASGLTAQTKAVGSGRSTIVYGRLCFDPVLVREAKREYPPAIFVPLITTTGHHPLCEDPWPSEADLRRQGGTDTLTFQVVGSRFGPIRYSITTRSTFGIYRFLGRILATQSMDRVRLRPRREENEDTRILAVTNRKDSQTCFVDLEFGGGDYCVPWRGADNTKRIFSLLAQLLALRIRPGDLAITPTVRVTP